MWEAGWKPPVAEFPLCIHGPVELVGIARKIGVVPYNLRFILDPAWPGPRNDGLQLAYFAILKRVRSFAETIGKTSRKRKLVQRVYPVGPEIVELPIRVYVALLHGVVRTHALIERHDICLSVREVVGLARKVHRVSVRRK